MSLELDRLRIEKVMDALLERTDGEWLLIGGALVAIWLEPRRVTEDIDVIGLGGTAAERMTLFSLAADEGLPIEALNSAADFFVQRIPDWRSQIDLMRSGGRGRLYRPSPTLFLLLKIGRLSANDLADCFALLDRVREESSLELDTARVRAALTALTTTEDADLAARRAQLLERLER